MNEKFARWWTLFLLYLKRDWKKMIIWILAIGLFSAIFLPAMHEITKGDGILALYETLQNPAMISMVGPTPVESASEYTVGAMYAHMMLLFSGLIAMIVSILHVVGHTRKEEELGLSELVRSFQVGRQASSLAVLKQTVSINIILAVFIALFMLVFNVDSITVEGAFLFGASIGMAGIIGAVIALLIVQIMPTSSGATGTSLGIVGLLYILRAGTDPARISLSKLNPMGWTYLTFPFTKNNWFLLLFALIFSIIVTVIAFLLEGARDLGAGYLPERKGRASAKKSLLSVPGLFLRLSKGVLIGWLIGFAVLGAAYGSIYGDMQGFLESNEILKQMFTYAGVSIEDSFTATIMVVMVSLVTILPIAIVNKLYSEESRLHLSQLFSTKVTRKDFYWTTIGIAIVSGLVGILLAAASLGGTALSVIEASQVMKIEHFLAAGYNLLPSVLFFIGLAALALGWAPKLGKLVYVYLAYSFILNYFSGLLNFPEWFLKTAILSWHPRMPMEDFAFGPFIIISIISIAFMVIGYIGYRKRDMHEGS